MLLLFVQLRHSVGRCLPQKDIRACVELCRLNMEAIYNKAMFKSVGAKKAGWSSQGKLKELFDVKGEPAK